MTEQEKRMHRCCFSGHRAEKLQASESEIKAWLECRITGAIAEGYVTFLTGMGMGVDIWAAQIIARRKVQNPALHLIAVIPYPGFEARWSKDWQNRYQELLKQADVVRYMADHYTPDALEKRTAFLLNHSACVIAYYNGEVGTTRSLIDQAYRQGLETVVGIPTRRYENYIAYDFETTGLSSTADAIIEIGAVKVIGGVETETFQSFVRPYEGAELRERITQLTGITPQNVAEAPALAEVLPAFLAFAEGLPMLGYNSIAFDHAFLQRAGKLCGHRIRNEQFDVMLYASQYRKELALPKPRVSLTALSQQLNIVNPQAHRALADALTTSRCYLAIRERTED